MALKIEYIIDNKRFIFKIKLSFTNIDITEYFFKNELRKFYTSIALINSRLIMGKNTNKVI